MIKFKRGSILSDQIKTTNLESPDSGPQSILTKNFKKTTSTENGQAEYMVDLSNIIGDYWGDTFHFFTSS
jgi:hypothetical protein